MSNYALIKNGIVDNIVVWDGEGEIFSNFTSCKIDDGEVVGAGFSAEQDNNKKWVFTAPLAVISEEEAAAANLLAAQSAYAEASEKISSLNEIIEDEDFTVKTEDEVKSSLTAWIAYRKLLRSYLATGNGSDNLPSALE